MYDVQSSTFTSLAIYEVMFKINDDLNTSFFLQAPGKWSNNYSIQLPVPILCTTVHTGVYVYTTTAHLPAHKHTFQAKSIS